MVEARGEEEEQQDVPFKFPRSTDVPQPVHQQNDPPNTIRSSAPTSAGWVW